MNDNLDPLRQAMSDLAEHGGSTDMYERSLNKSRQTQRRARLATGAAAAAVVFAIGGVAAVAGANRPHPSTAVATQPPAPSVAVTSPAPSVAPTSPTPSTKPPSSAPPSSTKATGRYPDCPSAKTLEKLADLPDGWSFPSSSIECWRTWATAAPMRPGVGDGIYLFHYKASTGWQYHSQGSAYDCKDLGITTGNPPFCSMEK
ncbi:hypothetical protein HH310_22225 [Actinoplanes sp. TBRC 11911]|uniref:hypothetical protein n=1 Tax=Actinoplanes sp. TBRC 11911 TaxID=2729386 RepID=UPI00145FABC1|nr:hypothetical protein [Actinoplanes sp. TBRC 11911]NMO53884.1 hypothetical protein [Actinoplanes sp. TBRC 11911]